LARRGPSFAYAGGEGKPFVGSSATFSGVGMEGPDGSWRIDAFALGLRTAPKLRSRIDEVLPAERVPALMAWLVILEAMPRMYERLATLDPPTAVDREPPLQMYAVLSPLRQVIRDAVAKEVSGMNPAQRLLFALSLPDDSLPTTMAQVSIDIELAARAFPEPLPYWSGSALGLVASAFERLGLPEVVPHLVHADDAEQLMADLIAGRAVSVAEYPIHPVEH